MDTIEIFNIFIKWAIPLACASGVAFIIKQLKFNIAMRKSQVSMLRSQIVSKCEKYLDQGYLPDYARYCLEELFKNYQAMGGNHGTGLLVDKCFELPLKAKPIRRKEETQCKNG